MHNKFQSKKFRQLILGPVAIVFIISGILQIFYHSFIPVVEISGSWVILISILIGISDNHQITIECNERIKARSKSEYETITKDGFVIVDTHSTAKIKKS